MFFDFILLIALLIIWITVEEVATILLKLTGLSSDKSRFQSISALTGTGFTTKDSEEVVNHPQRRRIITALMIIGYVVWGTFVAFIVSNLRKDVEVVFTILKIAAVFLMVLLIYRLNKNRDFFKNFRRKIEVYVYRKLRIRQTQINEVLAMKANQIIAEVSINETSKGIDKTLTQLALTQKKILVLGIERQDGTVITTPTGKDKIMLYDNVICYGDSDSIKKEFYN